MGHRSSMRTRYYIICPCYAPCELKNNLNWIGVAEPLFFEEGQLKSKLVAAYDRDIRSFIEYFASGITLNKEEAKPCFSRLVTWARKVF